MLEVEFDEWQWEEELKVFSLEDVGLGKSYQFLSIFS